MHEEPYKFKTLEEIWEEEHLPEFKKAKRRMIQVYSLTAINVILIIAVLIFT